MEGELEKELESFRGLVGLSAQEIQVKGSRGSIYAILIAKTKYDNLGTGRPGEPFQFSFLFSFFFSFYYYTRSLYFTYVQYDSLAGLR